MDIIIESTNVRGVSPDGRSAAGVPTRWNGEGVSNILVVEAEAIVRNVLISVLSRHGFTVYEAATASEALTVCQSLKNEPLDLLIADHVTMERETTEVILAAYPNTKVLHISGWPFETVEEAQALLPGSSFLQKPFTAVELLRNVLDLLNPRMH